MRIKFDNLMSPSDIMCNGHKFVKSSLFQSPGYLADLSPYISAVISSRLLATPLEITSNAIKPLAPLAQSILPARATSFILNGTLTCEYCLHQVQQTNFDDGQTCPALLLERLSLNSSLNLNQIDGESQEFVTADQLLEAQDRCRVNKLQKLHQLKSVNTNVMSTSNASTSTSSNSHSTSSSSSDKTVIKNELGEGTINLSGNNCKPDSNNDSNNEPTLKGSNDAYMFKDDILIMQICPEIGLHAQGFACVDCNKEINLNSSRLCHYDGRYYCCQCHTGSSYVAIPARVLRNWDPTPKPVSKLSLRKICYLRTKPILFNLFQINSMLYGFLDRLIEIKQIRERIQSMLKYLEICKQPNKPYLLSVPKHFLNENLLNYFTFNDLLDINQVFDLLSQLQTTLETHIVLKCISCRGKGYYCELCKDPYDILFPFSKNGIACTKCHTVYHKNCFQRKKKNCPKCLRVKNKKKLLDSGQDDLNSLADDESIENEKNDRKSLGSLE